MLKNDTGARIMFQDDRDKVVMLVHCFRATPRVFDELAQLLFDHGFSVYSVRLPGHGFVDDDAILQVKKGDWENHIENIFLDLHACFNKVYVCGLSIGATLVYNMTCKYPGNAEKIALLSPYVKPKIKHLWLGRIYGIYKKKIKPRDVDCSRDTEIKEDFNQIFPIPQGVLCMQIVKKAYNNLKKYRIPALVVLAKNDGDVPFDLQYETVKDRDEFEIIILEKSLHQVTLDVEKDFVHQKVLEYFQ